LGGEKRRVKKSKSVSRKSKSRCRKGGSAVQSGGKKHRHRGGDFILQAGGKRKKGGSGMAVSNSQLGGLGSNTCKICKKRKCECQTSKSRKGGSKRTREGTLPRIGGSRSKRGSLESLKRLRRREHPRHTYGGNSQLASTTEVVGNAPASLDTYGLVPSSQAGGNCGCSWMSEKKETKRQDGGAKKTHKRSKRQDGEEKKTHKRRKQDGGANKKKKSKK
jgi:hypothetical protein